MVELFGRVLNLDFVKDGALHMTPAILIAAWFLIVGTTQPADWLFHMSGSTAGNYPPVAPYLVSAAYGAGLLPLFVILLLVIAPYLLFHRITGNHMAGTLYLYASGIPWIMMWGGFFGQAVEHIWMLFMLVSPWFWLPMAFLSFLTHREWLAATLVSIVVYVARDYMEVLFPCYPE